MKDLTEIIKAVLEAVATGDTMGMPTEGMTQENIQKLYPVIDHLVSLEYSPYRKNEVAGTITDDMGQNLYLILSYLADKKITIDNSVRGLQRWLVECDGDRFMGPSSRRALQAIENGESIYTAGINGISCGAIMRVPSTVLCTSLKDPDALKFSIMNACVPTHNTSEALEAAA